MLEKDTHNLLFTLAVFLIGGMVIFGIKSFFPNTFADVQNKIVNTGKAAVPEETFTTNTHYNKVQDDNFWNDAGGGGYDNFLYAEAPVGDADATYPIQYSNGYVSQMTILSKQARKGADEEYLINLPSGTSKIASNTVASLTVSSNPNASLDYYIDSWVRPLRTVSDSRIHADPYTSGGYDSNEEWQLEDAGDTGAGTGDDTTTAILSNQTPTVDDQNGSKRAIDSTARYLLVNLDFYRKSWTDSSVESLPSTFSITDGPLKFHLNITCYDKNGNAIEIIHVYPASNMTGAGNYYQDPNEPM